MTPREKQKLCELMAGLFSPPRRKFLREIGERKVLSFLAEAMSFCGGDPAVLFGLHLNGSLDSLFSEVEKEYRRLFSGVEAKAVSLIESPHKPWTRDPECRLSFAREKGLLGGDPALHMRAIFQQAGLQVPEAFRACPDHLVLELEFLSVLYGGATDREVSQFIHDHLDWIPDFKKELVALRPHPFYLSAAELLDLFLKYERDRLERMDHGKKSVHA